LISILSGFVVEILNMETSQRKDVWSVGALYEPYVGRWSRLVARELLKWLSIPVQQNWLDVGCGTGALSQIISEQGLPNVIQGIDSSADFLKYAKVHVDSARATFEVGDAQALPIDSASFAVVVSGLLLNFLREPQQAVAEMARVTRPGGTVAAYVWDYAEKMELIRYFWDAAIVLDPAALEFDEGRRFPICQPPQLAGLFKKAGLQEIEVRPIDVPTFFRDFDDYWSPFLGGQGPAPGYAMSLSEERREALREQIRSNLPIAKGGSIPLMARVWAVRGHAPRGQSAIAGA
jgi:SAM-dependent methyltransferase